MKGDSLWHKLRNKPFLAMLGGFAIAGVAVGILVLFALVWVEPTSAPEKAGTVQFHTDHFTLWYQKGATGIACHTRLSEELRHDLDDLTRVLKVDPKLIPDPIDVFVHDNISAMQSSIAKRKSPNSRGGYMAPLDLLAGESPRRRLAELVLAFGWGECGSSLLKQGMAIYAGDPQRNFHAVIAALPKRLYYPLPELILMEKRGRFTESLYEQFDSPYSPASILFSNLGNLYNLSVHGEASPEDIPALESASFVQFLIETKGGIDAARRAWGRGSTVNLLRRINDGSIEDLGARWHARGIEEGKNAPDFRFLSVYYLLAAGFPDTAWRMCSAWPVENLSQDEISVAVRCAIAVGEFSDAAGLISHLEKGEERDTMRSLLELFKGWTVTEYHEVRTFVSPHVSMDASAGMSNVEGTLDGMIERLSLTQEDLPERMTVFLYPSEEIQKEGESLVPLSSSKNATLQMLPGNNLSHQIAEVLPVYAWGKDTYSHLLREGVVTALSSDRSLLVGEGRKLRREEHWFPLSSVDYGMTSKETVEVESGLLIDYILDRYGGKALREIWVATSPLGQYLSFDHALSEVCSTTRGEIEEELFSSTLSLRKS